MMARSSHARISAYHSPKSQLLGNRTGQVAPAWKGSGPAPQDKGKAAEQGSKILVSRLPTDVGETEVQELFHKTVGPVKEAFIVYNSMGNSKGMAIVTFHRTGDAIVAKSKYDGKIVDRRRPIKLEIITESVPSSSQAHTPRAPTLLERLGNLTKAPTAVNGTAPPTASAKFKPKAQKSHIGTHTVGGSKNSRQKKGPRRVKKSFADLDKEMEDYSAAVVDTL